MEYKVNKTEDEWRKELSPDEYQVIRGKGTERPFTGKFNMHFGKGTYSCKACGFPLFSSDAKFDSHCGWPSFDAELQSANIIKKRDVSHGMIRTEILCPNCGGHLGHIFDDGPTETGLRYCVNSVSLGFTPESE